MNQLARIFYKTFFIVLLALCCFLLISTVNASDVDNSTSDSDLILINDTSDDVNVSDFEILSLKINETPVNQTLTIDSDYEYSNGSNKGILISKPITIDGAGHTLFGNKLSRMFNITADNVVIKNLNFVNGNAFGRYSGIAGGGAIYWSGVNGLIENCSFINNTGSGIEDDPYDKEETIILEDGTVMHTISIRPMGAKINEGGAIVWKGSNGIVSKCRFVNNVVGYPNTGGAICWRGNDGKILDSEFYENNAWCGSAVAWIGDNGTILKSIVANSTFFDGGIYWFGHNGVIKDSILLGNGHSFGLNPSDGDVNADYNFWGDTIDNPNQMGKINNVSNWLVMNFTHNGEFVKKGQEIVINYDIINLIDKKGNIIKYDALVNKSGQLTYTVPKTGFLNITFNNAKVNVGIDTRDHIFSKDLTGYYTAKTAFRVIVSDVNGKVKNKNVDFTINKKTYHVKTDKNGVAILKVKLNPGKYTITSKYGKVKVKNKITVKSTLITKNVYKKVKKSGKFTVKVLNSKGKVLSKKLVKVKFKGKTYKLKTNKKGIGILKLSKKLKVGKYTIKTTCNGLTNSNKIIVKK